MKKSIIISVLFVAILMWTFSAEAWWGRGRGGPGADPGWQGSMYGLNLTQGQAAKMNSLHQAFAKDTADLNAKIYQKQLELNGLLLQTTPDGAKITGLQKEISGLQLQLNEKSVSYQLEARKVLTPEQIAQLPAGCTFGFGNMLGGGGPGPGYGCGRGPGCGNGYSRGYGCGRGPGSGRGCAWW